MSIELNNRVIELERRVMDLEIALRTANLKADIAAQLAGSQSSVAVPRETLTLKPKP